jgi:hypothetical protein
MLGIGAIEIEEATYSLGMCGHIVVRINATNKRYRIQHTMSEGWRVSESDPPWGENEWTAPKRMEPSEFILLLPEDRGWSESTFVAVWAGFAAGHEKGLMDGRCSRAAG